MGREQISYIKVKKKDGQNLIKFIREFNKSILNKRFKIILENNWIFFPLTSKTELINEIARYIKNKIDFDIILRDAIKNPNYKHKTLQDALENKIPEKFNYLIPKSYDIVGNIAIIDTNNLYSTSSITKKDLIILKKKIARSIIEVNKNINSVYEKRSEIKGHCRLRELTILHGEDNPETIHKENKCVFKLDVKRVFFTPRLVHERKRITSSNIKENEIIVDMFAGVGPFSIQIAKNHEVKIHAFDINQHAYNYLKENIKLNKIKKKITPYNLDVKSLLDPSSTLGMTLKNSVDRIIMNLPENSLNFIDIACFLLKKTGGLLHNYQFCERPNPIEKAIENLKVLLINYDWSLEKVLNAKIVKTFSPKSDLIVVDLLIKSLTS